MKFTKPDLHLLVVCIASLVLLAVGGARVFHASNDFVLVYAGARCLVHGCEPYAPSQLEPEFFQAGGQPSDLPSWQIDVPVYPPSTFLFLFVLLLRHQNLLMLILFLLYLAAIFSLRLSGPAAIDPSPIHEPAIPAHR